ncbi:MAG TPA: hypothetical protein VFQ85_08710 [Mycobacteriales bacterium]|jgi:predicted RNase H-like HicB family nuclease|nr:hypothetical protein [Mycobacteriales bacterium]
MTYRVHVVREGAYWLADGPALPRVHTYAADLAALDANVREAVALVAGLPEGAEPGLALEWAFV